jgi:hypothetical protein
MNTQRNEPADDIVPDSRRMELSGYSLDGTPAERCGNCARVSKGPEHAPAGSRRALCGLYGHGVDLACGVCPVHKPAKPADTIVCGGGIALL